MIFQNIDVKNIFSIYDFGKSIKYYVLGLETLSIYFFNIVRKDNDMKLQIKICVLAAIACFAFGIAGCGEKDTAESVGKNIDKTIESTKDAMHEAESAAESSKETIHEATK